jgi:dihydrofolate reductase
MPLIVIAACAGERQVIGDRGTLPWHYSSDLQFFKRTTIDQTLLMGRATHEAIIAQFGRPLPRRRVLIVSRNPQYQPPEQEVFPSIAAALAVVAAEQPLYVVGGAQIYEQTLPLASTVLLTHIDRDIAGDAFFPRLDPARWHCTATTQLQETDGTQLRFCTYTKEPMN